MKIKIIRILSYLFNKAGLWKFHFFLHIAAQFNNTIAKPKILIIDGKKLFIHKKDDPVSNSLYFYSKHEPFEISLFQKLIKEGDVVVDVGAHIGYYTLIASGLVGKTGRVFSFEPDPNNLLRLQQCVTANKLSNVVIVNRAVSNENKGDNRMFMINHKEKCIQVESITLDKYFAKSKLPIDFIKMDIQGAEVKALQGMSDILRKNQDIILILEFWPYGYSHTGNNAKELLDLLEKYKFLFYHQGINEAANKLIPISTKTLLEDYRADNLSESTNILCIRNNSKITSLL